MATDPSPSDSDPTLETYERIAQSWAAAHDATGPGWTDEYAAFRKALPRGRVLEIGCGSGRDAERFLQDGYLYAGLEPCVSFAALTMRRLECMHGWSVSPGKSAIDLVGDMPSGSADGCWAMASLLHVPHARIGSHLRAIRDVLRRGGIFAMTLKKGDGERIVDRSMDGIVDRRFFAFHQPQEMHRRLTDELGFRPVGANWTETRVGGTDWLFFLMRKR